MRKIVLVLLGVAACGGKGSSTPDAARIDATPPIDAAPPSDAPPRGDAKPVADANENDASNDPTFGALMPRVVAGDSSAVLTSPIVRPITWDSDVNRTYIEQFIREYAASAAWPTQVSEYGVGALSEGEPVHLSGAPAASVTSGQLEAMLRANLGAGLPWGPPDPQTLYSFFVPDGTIVHDPAIGACCTDYDGFHSDTTVGGMDVPYAVQCQCPGFDGPDFTNLQQLTIVASHETVEAVTDPHYAVNPAFSQTDDAHAAWTIVTGGETADMCTFADDSFFLPAGMIDDASRIWSNNEAALGHDPCVSEGMSPYYQAIPADADSIAVMYYGTWPTKGTKIANGATGTIALTLFANPDSGPYKVVLEDFNSYWNGSTQLLQFTQPGGQYNPGDTINVTTKVLATAPDLKTGELYIVQTTPVAGGMTTYYYALVGQ
jgi:hypothetical protein